MRSTHNVVQRRASEEDKESERPKSAGIDMSSVLGNIYGDNEAPTPTKPKEVGAFKKLGNKVLMHNAIADVRGLDIKKEEERARKAQRADIAIYALFMFFFTLNTIDGLGDQSHYVFTQRVTDTLNMDSFKEVNDVNGLNSWLEEELIPGIYSDNFEGSNTTNITTGATGWLIQGPVRVSQIRSNLFKCAHDLHPNLRNYPYQCTHSRNFDYMNGKFDEDYEETETFRGFTYNTEHVDSVKYQREDVPYSWYETPMRHSFPAPGFAVLVDPHQAIQVAEETVARLVQNRYVDVQTNVVFIDLSIYNYILDFSAWVRLTAEFNSAGGIDCHYEVITVQLYWPPSQVAYKMTLQVFTFLGYFYFGCMLGYRVYRYGRDVLSQVLSWVQLVNIIFYIIQLGFRYDSYGLMAGGGFSSHSIGEIDFLGRGFIDIRPAVRAMRLAITFQSMNTFLNWFKMVGYLATFPVFALMTKTLEHASAELRAFSIVFCIIMFGFAQAHCMFFGKQLSNYRTVVDSFLTLFRAMLGDFNFEEMYEINYVIGPLFFIMFVGIAFLVVLNIIIAIVADAYVQANEERKVHLIKEKARKEEAKVKKSVKNSSSGSFRRIKFPKFQRSNKVSSAVFAKKAASMMVSPKKPSPVKATTDAVAKPFPTRRGSQKDTVNENKGVENLKPPEEKVKAPKVTQEPTPPPLPVHLPTTQKIQYNKQETSEEL